MLAKFSLSEIQTLEKNNYRRKKRSSSLGLGRNNPQCRENRRTWTPSPALGAHRKGTRLH